MVKDVEGVCSSRRDSFAGFGPDKFDGIILADVGILGRHSI